MLLEDDPGDLGAGDAVGGKLGVGAGIHPPEVTGRPLPGRHRADDAADVPDRRGQGAIENRADSGETRRSASGTKPKFAGCSM